MQFRAVLASVQCRYASVQKNYLMNIAMHWYSAVLCSALQIHWYCVQCCAHCTVHSAHCAVHSAYCAVHWLQCTADKLILWGVLCTVHSAQFALQIHWHCVQFCAVAAVQIKMNFGKVQKCQMALGRLLARTIMMMENETKLRIMLFLYLFGYIFWENKNWNDDDVRNIILVNFILKTMWQIKSITFHVLPKTNAV